MNDVLKSLIATPENKFMVISKIGQVARFAVIEIENQSMLLLLIDVGYAITQFKSPGKTKLCC
jgi:hypothetical protein